MSFYHFIAIGGAVMHNLALELLALGNKVTGSDDEIFDPARSRLQEAGILPLEFGWLPDKISPEIDAIILGMHARSDNPELIKAKELGLKIYSFPEFIYEHSRNKKRVVIAGSHGKTTSTAMLMHILNRRQLSFDYLVGSLIDGYDRMVKLSDAPIIVIEGDEYLTSPLDRRPKFLHYHPHVAMITGIAWDHINVFPTFEGYVEQFQLFTNTVLERGFVFKGIDADFLNFSSSSAAWSDYDQPQELGGRTFSFFGQHNFQNAAGVVAIAETLGISASDAWDALTDFPGTAKRLEKLSETENLIVYRDFAHAPSKVKATVSAVREQYPNHRFIAIFELHTFSSLMPEFMVQYAGCFEGADLLRVVYDPHVFELKKMDVPSAATIESRLQVPSGTAISTLHAIESALNTWLSDQSQPTVLLLMSSGKLMGYEARG